MPKLGEGKTLENHRKPLKQKKPSQNLNVEPALLNFKKNTSLPESSILIYVGSHQKWVVRLFFVIKISFISLVGLFLYLLYKNDFDIVGKLGPALKLENWEMVIVSIELVFMLLFISRVHRAYVLKK